MSLLDRSQEAAVAAAPPSAPRTLRVLLVEDSENDAELLLSELRRGGFAPNATRVDTIDALQTALANRSWDIIISDYLLPGMRAPEALALVQQSGVDLPFIVVSGTVGEESTVEAMKAGAHDYITKDNLARLVPAVE